MPILFSLKRVIKLLFCFYTGLLPFLPLKESFYEIIMPSVIKFVNCLLIFQFVVD